jgi:hypothetical protein
MSVDHGPASRDIADQQDDYHAEEKERRAEGSRAEVKVGVNNVNSDASPEDSPAATVRPMQINESSKAEGKHPGQRPKAAVRDWSQKGRLATPRYKKMILYLGRTDLLRASWLARLESAISYSFTVTGVPTGAFSKNGLAIPLGKRMQPCDAAYGGT